MEFSAISAQNTLSAFVNRLSNIHAAYRRLEIDYSHLPLSSRRYLFGNTIDDERDLYTIAHAKFYLAGILEWSPTSFAFDVGRFVEAGGPYRRAAEETHNELCPLWESFFDDVLLAANDVERYCRRAETRLSAEEAGCADELITSAESKLTWALKLFAIVAKKGKYVKPCSYSMEITTDMLYMGWNRICIWLERGTSLEDILAPSTLENLQRRRPEPVIVHDILKASSSTRIWYSLVIDPRSPPWTHPRFYRRKTPETNDELYQQWLSDRKMQYMPTQLHRPTEDPAPLSLIVRDDGNTVEERFSCNDPSHPLATKLGEYNARWSAVAADGPCIPFPCESLTLQELTEGAGFDLGVPIGGTLSLDRAIELRAAAFFLRGTGIEYSTRLDTDKGMVLLPNLGSGDVHNLRELQKQIHIETERWHPGRLGRRTGVLGLFNEDLGMDFVVVAIRAALYDLDEICRVGLGPLYK